MQEVARVVSECFMMALCVMLAPADQQEMRIDVVGDRGYVDTAIVQRDEDGFTVYDEMNGRLVEFATIVPKDGAENVFVCTYRDGKKEAIDLAQGIKGLDVAELRTKDRVRLTTADEGKLSLDRSGKVLFLTASALKRTYVVH